MRTTVHGTDGIDPSEGEVDRTNVWLVSPAGRVLAEYSEDPRPVEESLRRRLSELEALVGDLFRCEHGRKSGDDCLGCGMTSSGNVLQGSVIARSLDGRVIRLPEGPWWEHTNPASWPKEEG